MLSVEVTSLKKSYGDLKAVDGVSFSVSRGKSLLSSAQMVQGRRL